MKAAVAGASGYTGTLLVRMLLEHPEIKSLIPASTSKAGEDIAASDPGLSPVGLEKTEITAGKYVSIGEAAALKPDVVFGALPHLKSAGLLAPFFGKAVVIDLSADFRLKDPVIFEQSYGSPPPRPDLLDEAVYGLCEWYGAKIRQYDIIANPGCYPTVSLLPLLPLAAAELISGRVIINAISGISGAGKKLEENLLFAERTENAGAYLPGTRHRHASEIQSELAGQNGNIDLLFTPHLAPLKQGMAATIACRLAGGKEFSHEDIAAVYRSYYGKAPFIKINYGVIPQTAHVWGTNRCDISWQIEGDTLLVFSAIDNLVKGASGQAVQNMNIRFGLEETAGLRLHSMI